jgi:phosphoglycolate phosphatase-like HAD superfamily hydrolase
VLSVEVLACDWNGTLVDDVTRAWRATTSVLLRRGLDSPDLRSFLDSFRLPLRGFFADHGVKRAELAAAEAEWNAAVAAEPALPMPGVLGMLDRLENMGVAVGVVSAAEEGVVRAEAAALGLEDLLAFVVGSASPKREALGALVETYGEHRVAYVGDTEHDVQETLSVGALAIGFGGGYRPAEALRSVGADCVVNELARVPEVIATLPQRTPKIL